MYVVRFWAMPQHPYLYILLKINDGIRDAECSLCHCPIPCDDGTSENVKAWFDEHVRRAHPEYATFQRK